jgi:hypothetical protein
MMCGQEMEERGVCSTDERKAASVLKRLLSFLAVSRGLEPPTRSLGNCCSIQLNYETKYHNGCFGQAKPYKTTSFLWFFYVFLQKSPTPSMDIHQTKWYVCDEFHSTLIAALTTCSIFFSGGLYDTLFGTV